MADLRLRLSVCGYGSQQAVPHDTLSASPVCACDFASRYPPCCHPSLSPASSSLSVLRIPPHSSLQPQRISHYESIIDDPSSASEQTLRRQQQPVAATTSVTESSETAMTDSLSPDAPAPRFCHLNKWPDFDGYGFNLHAEKSKTGQFVGKVDEQSPAQAAGLREGDRIIEVNGVNIANENHRQVRFSLIPVTM